MSASPPAKGTPQHGLANGTTPSLWPCHFIRKSIYCILQMQIILKKVDIERDADKQSAI